MDDLIEQVEGRWRASVTVDQIYAHYQESHPEFRHPDGGQAFYVRDTVYFGDWLRKIADGLIDEWGVGIETKMRETAEGMVKGVYVRAPWEFNDLRKSGAPEVKRGQATVYHREPLVKRLGEGALRDKKRLSYLFDKNRYRTNRFG
jgi:hypothetical protein